MKPSVLLVFDGYGPGGDYGVCLDLAALLGRGGHGVKLIARSDDIDDILQGRAEAFGVAVGLYKSLEDCLECTHTPLADYDVVHVHYPGNYLPAKLATQYRRAFSGKPIVVTLHGPMPVLETCRTWRQRASAKVGARCLDAFAVPSPHKVEELQAARLYAGKLHCLPNPVREMPMIEQSDARGRLGLPLDRTLLLWVGRIGPEKSPEVLLRALPTMQAVGIDPILAFVGPDYGIGGEIRELLDRHAKNVRLLGYLNEPAVAYSACDAVVLTSRHESFSLVLFEAAASARPIVAPDIPVVNTVFQDLPAVSVYPWGKADELARAVAVRLREARPEDALSLRDAILESYGHRAALETHARLYERLVQQGHR